MLCLLMNKLSKFTWSSLLYSILNLNFKSTAWESGNPENPGRPSPRAVRTFESTQSPSSPKIRVGPVPEQSGFSDRPSPRAVRTFGSTQSPSSPKIRVDPVPEQSGLSDLCCTQCLSCCEFKSRALPRHHKGRV